MSTYKRLWGILPLAIIFVIALCGAFAVMPQLARADDPDNPEANQTTEAVDGEKEEPSGSSESKDAVEPEPSKSSDSGASSSSSSSSASSSSSGSSASSSSSDSGASSSSSGSEASKEAPSENKSDDLEQKSSSLNEKKTSVKKQDEEGGYGIWVQGVQVTSSNASDVLGNKTVVYDNDKKTLTLKSAKLQYGEPVLEGKPVAAISVSRTDGLTIVLEGDSSIADGEPNADSVAGLYVGGSGKVTFGGEGTLTLDVKNAASSADDVSVYGIYSDGGAVEIGRKTKVTAKAGAAKGGGKSIGAKGSVKVSSLAVLTAIGQDQALMSTPDIKDSTVGGALVNKDAKAAGRRIWDGKQSLDGFKYVRIPGAHHTAAKSPTCTTDGNIEYWYDEVEGKYYSDSSLTTEVAKDKCVLAKLGHSWDKGKVTKAATATKDGVRTYTCTRCKATKKEKIRKTGIKYTLTAGANGTWTKGTQLTLNFTFKRSALENNQDTTFKHFTGIKVDKKAVDKSNYTYQSGSVVIKLKPTYLEKLSTGTHTISASFNDYDGKAPSTKFTVKPKTNTKGNSTTPKTGDQVQVIGWVIAGIVAAIIAVIAFRRMRRTDK